MTPIYKAAYLSLGFALICSGAHADLSISNKPTHDMSCSAGVCAATAKGANLSVSDLTNMLAAGDTAVKTGGGAITIQVQNGFSWTSSSRLTLDVNHSIGIHKPVVVAGGGAVTITYNDGGSGGDLLFSGGGKIDFWDTNSSLIINGNSYTLVTDLKTFADDANLAPQGLYAFAKDYDASADGTYSDSLVHEPFSGTFEGLGNTISGLTILSQGSSAVGLFYNNRYGTIRDVRLTRLQISVPNPDFNSSTGGLTGENEAIIIHASISGSINVTSGGAGGLAGLNQGSIGFSESSVKVSGGTSAVGGLVGGNDGDISQSISRGEVHSSAAIAGGFAGENDGAISLSHSYGKVVSVGNSDRTGGFVGVNLGSVTNSSAAGAVQSQSGVNGGVVGTFTGGFAGMNAWHITGSSATGSVEGRGVFGESLGGLVGLNTGDQISGTIDSSYATGNVTISKQNRQLSESTSPPKFHCSYFIGGLSGEDGYVSNSYAFGAVTGGSGACLGGLVGLANTKVSYSTGAINVAQSKSAKAGGYVGYDTRRGQSQIGYWDTDTSGTGLGCGHGACTGVTGLTDAQLKSGLPAGFDPNIWGQNPNINNGYPYLLANPPQ